MPRKQRVSISCQIDFKDYEAAVELSYQKDCTLSQILREALSLYLRTQPPKK